MKMRAQCEQKTKEGGKHDSSENGGAIATLLSSPILLALSPQSRPSETNFPSGVYEVKQVISTEWLSNSIPTSKNNPSSQFSSHFKNLFLFSSAINFSSHFHCWLHFFVRPIKAQVDVRMVKPTSQSMWFSKIEKKS